MVKRTIEIEDTLDEIIESVKSDIKNLAIEWIKENSDKPDLSNNLDYDGSVHEIIDGSVPVYIYEINNLFYLYGDEFEQAFDDAGIGAKEDKCWPSGWKPAAIYCYIEQKINEWYNDAIDEIYEENKKEEKELGNLLVM